MLIQDESKEPPDSKDPKKIVISTRCKRCDVGFTRATILKHISHSNVCKKQYTRKELLLFKEWTKEEIEEKRKKTYDPEKRRKIYLKQKKEKTDAQVNIFIVK